jgi:HSP20 family protein
MNVRDLVPWVHRPERNQQGLETRPAEQSLFSLHREMDRLFDDMLHGFPGPALANRRAGWPQLEVEDTESEYRIHADLPGLDDKDVEVFMQDGVLTIRGEKRSQTDDRRRAFSERFYGLFERRLMLEGVDADRMQARFDKGVLTVTAPKSDEGRERIKRIPINAAAAQ